MALGLTTYEAIKYLDMAIDKNPPAGKKRVPTVQSVLNAALLIKNSKIKWQDVERFKKLGSADKVLKDMNMILRDTLRILYLRKISAKSQNPILKSILRI